MRLFPDYPIEKYFKTCEIGWAQPKSLGIATPLVHNCNSGEAEYPPLELHSNWSVCAGVEFRVGEMTLSEYLYFMSK